MFIFNFSLDGINLHFLKMRFVFFPSTCFDLIAYNSSVGKLMPYEIPSQTKYIILLISHKTVFWTTCLLSSAQAKYFQGHTLTTGRHLAQDERKLMFPSLCTISSLVTCIIPNLVVFLPMKGYYNIIQQLDCMTNKETSLAISVLSV